MKIKGIISLCLYINIVNAQLVTTFAGSGLLGSADGFGTAASFSSLAGICCDPFNNIFVSERNNKIRKITQNGFVTTFAGSGLVGSNDGLGIASSFNFPRGLCSDSVGNIYVADFDNHKIRKITPTGLVTTLAGMGVAGYLDSTGIEAKFNRPNGICIDRAGNLYVSELDNYRIRKITPYGRVTTYAGSGLSGSVDGPVNTASFWSSYGICIDDSNNVYIADNVTNKIRKISLGMVSTFAGSGAFGSTNGIGSSATFQSPNAVFSDNIGNILVASGDMIRKISSSGVVTTFAGDGINHHVDGIGTSAGISNPSGICSDSYGNIYISEGGGKTVRKISNITGIIDNEIFTEINVLPNPTEETLNVYLKPLLSKNTKIEIHNALGEFVMQETLSDEKTAITVSNFKVGLYTFHISVENIVIKSGKIIKQ